MKFGIIDFMMASLQVAFIVMKLCGVISWSWWIVMLPVLLAVVLNILVFLLIFCIKFYKSRQLIKQYGTDNLLVIRMKEMMDARDKLVKKMEKDESNSANNPSHEFQQHQDSHQAHHASQVEGAHASASGKERDGVLP